MTDVDSILNDLFTLNGKLVETCRHLLSVCENRRFFPCDEYVLATLNRASWQWSGFAAMVTQRNYIVCAPLVRLQLDNYIRLSGVVLHKNPHDVAHQVAGGAELRNIPIGDGKKKMTDRELVDQLADTWLSSLYEKTSGYIHLSGEHILHLNMMTTPGDDGASLYRCGPPHNYVPESDFADLALIFGEMTDRTMKSAQRWIAERTKHGTWEELSTKYPRK